MREVRSPAPWRATLPARVSVWGLLASLGFVLCVLSATAWLGRLGWAFELTTHFRPQYLVGLAALALLHAVARRWRSAMIFGAFALSNLLVLAPYLGLPRPPAPAGPDPLRVLLLNVHTENTRFERVRALVREADPDVLVLEEVNDVWLRELHGLRATHPHVVQVPRDDNFGIALLSRKPLRRAETVALGDADLPSIAAEIECGAALVTLIATHPLPPATPGDARLRDAQLADLARFLARRPKAWIVLGDLNVTPWSPAFTDLLRATGLVDTALGRGLRGTWPTTLPGMRIPIDHCLVSEGVQIVDRRLGPAVGSDHFPVLADLQTGR